MANYQNRTKGPLPLLLSTGRRVIVPPGGVVSVSPKETQSKTIENAIKVGALIKLGALPAAPAGKSLLRKILSGQIKAKNPAKTAKVSKPVSPKGKPAVVVAVPVSK